MLKSQVIADKYKDNPGEMIEKLWDYFNALPEEEAKTALKEPIEVTLFHGTRRKENVKEIKEKGFCTFNPGEVEEFIDKASAACKTEIKAGPRVRIQNYKTKPLGNLR